MKSGKILTAAILLLFFATCKKDATMPVHTGGNDTTTTNSPKPTPYNITETFETGSKTAYAEANINLSTGPWDFKDALIGKLAGDAKDGNWSVRLRTGSISMNFDISGLTLLSFKHARYGSDGTSTWKLEMSTDGGVSYSQLGEDYTETSTALVADSVKISAAGKVRFRFEKSGTTRINIDDITFKGLGDPGITPGSPDTSSTDTTATGGVAGTRGIMKGPDAPPASGDNSDLLFGNPSGAVASIAMMDNYLMDQGYYTESYNATRGEPNWVSWHLDATNTTNASPRLDDFAGFNGLPSGWYVVQSNSYSGSGFDRGHNCPSADRTSSTDANASTFLMTNMIPQAPQNNQQTWANLENYLREQVVEGNEVYIVMGSYGTGGTGSKGEANAINNGHVNVPANIWKVAVILPAGNGDLSRVSSATRVIAVNTPNDNTISPDWRQYITTVRDIEKATGYNLLSALPQTVQDVIELKKDGGI